MHRLAAALVFVLAAPAFAADAVQSEDWYAVYVNEVKAGHAHTEVRRIVGDEPGAAARWVTTTDTFVSLAKLGSALELTLNTRVDEDAAGRVTAFRQMTKMSDREIVTEGTVDGDAIRLVQNGVLGEVTYPDGALGPAATDRRVMAAGWDAGTETKVLAFATDYPGEGAHHTFSVVGDESLRVIDRRLVLHRVEVRNAKSAARSMAMWFDGNGRMHVSESDVPGLGELRMVRTTERLAKSASQPAEVFATSLIEPDRGIPGPRRTKRLVLRLSRTDGEPFDASVYAGEGQSVTDTDDAGARTVTIERWDPPSDFTGLRRPVQDESLAPFLVPSAYIESDDEVVKAHAARAVGDEKDALVCARKIQAYVRDFVSDKSMDVGFATAAEVARTGEGDCSEHAMLAAGVARAAGLPSRVVMGIVYIPGLSSEGVGPRGAFGYHMWTEVLVGEDRWFPVDAALGGFDATHVALAKSELSAANPVSQMILPLLEAIASVQIEVVEVR